MDVVICLAGDRAKVKAIVAALKHVPGVIFTPINAPFAFSVVLLPPSDNLDPTSWIPPTGHIIDLDLKLRAHNALMKEGIDTINKLVWCTEDEIRDIRNIGDESISDIKAILAAKHLRLSDEPMPRQIHLPSGLTLDSPLADLGLGERMTNKFTAVEYNGFPGKLTKLTTIGDMLSYFRWMLGTNFLSALDFTDEERALLKTVLIGINVNPYGL